MPSTLPKLPRCRHHKARNLAAVTIAGKHIYLGPYGSPESKAKYREVIAEYLGAPPPLKPIKRRPVVEPADDDDEPVSIAELIEGYHAHTESYYVKAGRQTTEVGLIRRALRTLGEMFGLTLAAAFGPLALKEVREQFINEGFSRSGVNRNIGLIKQMFKLATENELIPPSVFQGLSAVAGLKKGRSQAKETSPVKPVPADHIDAVLPHLSPQVAAMVQLQRLTGMRPSEVCQMRSCDINTEGEIWEYRPQSWKTEHHSKSRVIMLGPRAQQVLRPWLRLVLDEYLFQPAEAEEARRKAQRAARKCKVYASQERARQQAKRRKQRRSFRPHYCNWSYNGAIKRACMKAGVPPWSANQLRHAAATLVRREFGIEVAQAVLGHSDVGTTAIYVERDAVAAQAAMARIG
jgi:integrase